MKQHALRSRTRAIISPPSRVVVAPALHVLTTTPNTMNNDTLMNGISSPLVTPTSKTPKFLRALYLMLEIEDPNVLRWSSNGQYFQVFNVEKLESEILPKYFNHGNFASFQRQLNNFGFRKWTKRRSSVCTFSHDTFTQKNPPPPQNDFAFFSFGPSTVNFHKTKRQRPVDLVKTEQQEEEPFKKKKKKICESPTTADALVMSNTMKSFIEYEDDPFDFEHEKLHELSAFEWEIILTTLTQNQEEEEDDLIFIEFEPFDYLKEELQEQNKLQQEEQQQEEEEEEEEEEELRQAATLFLMEEEI
jgi:hypothetical protein